MLKICLVLVLCVGCNDGPSDVKVRPARVAPAPATVAAAAPVTVPVDADAPIEVTARQIAETYAKDPTAADAAYRNKALRVNCLIGAGRGHSYIAIESMGAPFEARFTDEGLDAMRKLKRYDEVFLRCRGGGMLDGPRLDDCVLDGPVK